MVNTFLDHSSFYCGSGSCHEGIVDKLMHYNPNTGMFYHADKNRTCAGDDALNRAPGQMYLLVDRRIALDIRLERIIKGENPFRSLSL